MNEPTDKTAEETFVDGFFAYLNSPASREHHRRDFNDMEWAEQQPKGEPKYEIGDVVRFQAGGYGVIDQVSHPQGGWPSEYSAESVKGMPYHPKSKYAWHYEGDFAEHVARSPLHDLSPEILNSHQR